MAVRPQKRMNYDEYSRLPEDDGLSYELIDGELYMNPAPNTRHQDILGRLFARISAHLEMQGGGRIFFAPYEVDFFDQDAVQPDLVFVSDADSGIITEAKILGVPTLVAEVLSSSPRDRQIKRRLYERHGVPEYWIIDPISDQVEIYRLTAAGYEDPVVMKPGDRLSTPAIPALALDLAALFKR